MTNEPRRVYVPPAIGAEPTTPREAILSAAALLEEEGRWITGVFYNNKAADTPEYVDDPFCNGWGACAIGALQIVTLGVYRRETPDYCKPFDNDAGCFPVAPHWFTDEDRYSLFVDGGALPDEWDALTPAQRIYVDAHKLLDAAAINARPDDETSGIIGLNDDMGTTRDDVLAVFYAAAEIAATSEAVLVDG